MPELIEVFFCADFSRLNSELAVDAPPEVHRGLIGWRIDPPPVDSGPPESVAHIVAASLVRHVRVSYAEAIPRPFGSYSLRFRHATEAEDAEVLFDAPYVSWDLRAQRAFLSPLDSPPPAISSADYESDFTPAEFSRLSARGFTGLLLPGVDGDSAGLFVLKDPLWGTLVASLQEACETSGASWREVNESDFEARWAG